MCLCVYILVGTWNKCGCNCDNIDKISKLQCRYKPLQNSKIKNLVKRRKFNPFAPKDFAKKHILKLLEWFSGYCRAIISKNLPPSRLQVVHFASCRSRCKISLRSLGMRRKQNLGLKVTQPSWVLLFPFSPLLFFRLSCFIFFFCWASSKLHFVGKSF